jgi:hypothetical protein
MSNKLMKEVSHCLADMHSNKAVYYIYKWPEFFVPEALGDHLVITNDKRAVVLEEKMTIQPRLKWRNITKNPRQMQYNSDLHDRTLEHVYILGFYANRREPHYAVVRYIADLTREKKSTLSEEDLVISGVPIYRDIKETLTRAITPL